MARPVLPDMSPWRRQPLVIPPNSRRAWVSLAVWEMWVGVILAGAIGFGVQLIRSAPAAIITVMDMSNCYAAPSLGEPCERIAYRTGTAYAALYVWCGLLLFGVAAWLLWELWSAVAPKPITDDFLQLLDESFGRDWRRPRTWPWARLGWAYGFTFAGALAAALVALIVSSTISSWRPPKPPTVHVDTSERYRTSADGQPSSR